MLLIQAGTLFKAIVISDIATEHWMVNLLSQIFNCPCQLFNNDHVEMQMRH